MKRNHLILTILFICVIPISSQEKIPWIEPSPPAPRLLELPESMDDFGFRFHSSDFEQYGPVDFRYDETGDLFVFDYWNNRILKFDPQEKYIKTITLPKEFQYIIFGTENGVRFFSVPGEDKVILGMKNESYLFLNYVTGKFRIIDKNSDMYSSSIVVLTDYFFVLESNRFMWASLKGFIGDPNSKVTITQVRNKYEPFELSLNDKKAVEVELVTGIVRDLNMVYPMNSVNFDFWNPKENSEVLRKRANQPDEYIGRDSVNMYFLNFKHLVYVVNPQGKIIAPINFRKIVGASGIGIFRFAVKPNGNIVAFGTQRSFSGRHKQGKIFMFEFPRTW